jgi:ABC-type phosphate transport system auxiliary subunit
LLDFLKNALLQAYKMACGVQVAMAAFDRSLSASERNGASWLNIQQPVRDAFEAAADVIREQAAALAQTQQTVKDLTASLEALRSEVHPISIGSTLHYDTQHTAYELLLIVFANVLLVRQAAKKVDKSSAITAAHLQAAVAALRAELPTHASLQAMIATVTAAAAQQAAADNQQLQQRLEKLENSLAASRAENRKAVHALRAEGAERASLIDLQSYIPRSEVHATMLHFTSTVHVTSCSQTKPSTATA